MMKRSKMEKLEKSGYCVKEAAELLGLSHEEIGLIGKKRNPEAQEACCN